MDDCPECGGPRVDLALDGRAMCVQRHLWMSCDHGPEYRCFDCATDDELAAAIPAAMWDLYEQTDGSPPAASLPLPKRSP